MFKLPFDNVLRSAALCRGRETELSQLEEVEGTEEQHIMVLKKEKTECQMKKVMELKVKDSWHCPIGV